MATTIAILNFKGGCAKTTTTVNLADALHLLGKQVLVIDIDWQCNASDHLGYRVGEGVTAYELFTQKLADISPLQYRDRFDYFPSSIEMEDLPNTLINRNNREYILRRLVRAFSPAYDYILIDCPANGNILNTNAMAAADELIIPTICEPYDIKGLALMLGKVQTMIDDEVNESLKIRGFLITKYDGRLSLHKSFASEMRATFPGLVFNTRIHSNTDLPKASGAHQTIFEYNSKSAGASDYLQLAREITGSRKRVEL